MSDVARTSVRSDDSDDSEGEKSQRRSERSQVALCWRTEHMTVCATVWALSSGKLRTESRSCTLRMLSVSETDESTGGPASALDTELVLQRRVLISFRCLKSSGWSSGFLKRGCRACGCSRSFVALCFEVKSMKKSVLIAKEKQSVLGNTNILLQSVDSVCRNSMRL